MDGLNFFDAGILGALNAMARVSFTFDQLVAIISASNLLKGAAVLAVFAGLWSLPDERQDERRVGLVATLAAGVAAVAVCRALAAFLPFRPRPIHADFSGFVIPYGVANKLDGWSSFPSDHATLFFALAAGVVLVAPRLGGYCAAYVAGVIVLPRLYLGLHYPTDLIAGAALGVGIVLLFHMPAVRNRLTWVLAWERNRPGWFYAGAFLALFETACLFDHARELGSFGAGVARHVLELMGA